MTTHDSDPRYADSETRARVAVLYLPLLGIVMDTIPQLHSYLQDSHDTLHHIGFLDDYQGPQSSKEFLFAIKVHTNFSHYANIDNIDMNYSYFSCSNDYNQFRSSLCNFRQSLILIPTRVK